MKQEYRITTKTLIAKKEIAPFFINEVFLRPEKLKASVNFHIIVAVYWTCKSKQCQRLLVVIIKNKISLIMHGLGSNITKMTWELRSH